MKGSVFPRALGVGTPCAAIAFVLKTIFQEYDVEAFKNEDSVLRDNAAWSGFSFLVGFLIVFRTSQAYNRFWDGCIWTHQMRAEWFDACSSVVAFCKHSHLDQSIIENFKELLVRLFSMLHAAALAEIEDSCKSELEAIQAFHLDLIDPGSLDRESLMTVKNSDCKVEVLFQWIQQVIIENIETGVLTVPAPILSRSFQEIANGMLAFHQAIKISYIPFPFPYAQICDTLLLMHYCVVPIVCAQWTSEPAWAALFSFMQVFILWSLNFIAVEIENPFGMDENDLDAAHMQEEMNQHLRVLLKPEVIRSPSLNIRSVDNDLSKSFIQCWSDLSVTAEVEQEFITSVPVRSIRVSYHAGSSKGRMSRKHVRSSHHSTASGSSDNSNRSGGVKPFRLGQPPIHENSECNSFSVWGSEASYTFNSNSPRSMNSSQIESSGPPPTKLTGTAPRHAKEGLDGPTCGMSLRGVAADSPEDHRVRTSQSGRIDNDHKQTVLEPKQSSLPKLHIAAIQPIGGNAHTGQDGDGLSFETSEISNT